MKKYTHYLIIQQSRHYSLPISKSPLHLGLQNPRPHVTLFMRYVSHVVQETGQCSRGL